jgi:hypothetical protein
VLNITQRFLLLIIYEAFEQDLSMKRALNKFGIIIIIIMDISSLLTGRL